jgi:hypothetical protein
MFIIMGLRTVCRSARANIHEFTDVLYEIWYEGSPRNASQWKLCTKHTKAVTEKPGSLVRLPVEFVPRPARS